MFSCPTASTSLFKALPFRLQTLSFAVLWHLTKLETRPVSRGLRHVHEAEADLGSV